jgi:hypothetical protein
VDLTLLLGISYSSLLKEILREVQESCILLYRKAMELKDSSEHFDGSFRGKLTKIKFHRFN